jgi:putative membrane fusion protein
VVYTAYQFIHGLVVANLAQVEQVKQGVVQSMLPAAGVLLRNEVVMKAPGAGKLKIVVAEGERVRVGELVAQVVAPSLQSSSGEQVFDLRAPLSGIVGYTLDGLEEVYTLEKIQQLDLAKVLSMAPTPNRFLPGEQVAEGQAVCKIVNNLEPLYIIGEVDGELPSENDNKPPLSITFNPQKDAAMNATLLEENYRGQNGRVLLRMASYGKELITPRQKKFWIVTKSAEGIYTPVSAIVRKDGQDGVYTVYKEQVKWIKVEILARIEGKAVISGVTPDIKVVVNPEYVKEGYPLRNP